MIGGSKKTRSSAVVSTAQLVDKGLEGVSIVSEEYQT